MRIMRDVFTRKDWARLPEGFPAELVEGFLVKEPSPTYGHQHIAARIRHQLLDLVGPARVPDTPADVAVDELNVYHPDIVVLDRPPPATSRDVGVPLLVVEVLSPSTRARDREVKAGHLLELGVREVWLIDPAARDIEVRTRRDTRTAAGRQRLGSSVVPGFALVSARLFPASA